MKSWPIIVYVMLFSLVAMHRQTALAQENSPVELTFMGEQRIRTGTLFENTEFGGISGITYVAEDNIYYAITDDRSERNPSRFYTVQLAFDDEQFTDVTISDVTSILREDASDFPYDTVDGEAIRYIVGSDTLLWASEMDARDRPFVREMTRDGGFIRDYPIPDHYIRQTGVKGIHGNAAFEALTLSDDESRIYVGTEAALIQDGEEATTEAGSFSRIMVLARQGGELEAEYLYETDPVPHASTLPPYIEDNGLVELLPYDETSLLVIERSFALGVGNSIRIYLADFSEATNFAGEYSINELNVTPMTKTLLLTLEEGTLELDIDNIEGATWGPEINGSRTLVLVSDNNFNPLTQPFTQFLVFRVEP